MGDDDERGTAGEQVLGQPPHALDVEVVGRLVEHEQVELLHQGRGERDPLPLAAGEPLDRRVQAASAAGAQALDDGAAARVGGPLVVGDLPAQDR